MGKTYFWCNPTELNDVRLGMKWSKYLQSEIKIKQDYKRFILGSTIWL